MIFKRRFQSEGRTHSFSVERDTRFGWQAREEENDQVVKVTHCHDWHRVESMMTLFQQKASKLQQSGWQELTAVE